MFTYIFNILYIEYSFMHYKKALSIGLPVLFGCIAFISNTNLSAQPTLSKKPKIKDFGKSLKKYGKQEKINSIEHKSKVLDEEVIHVKTDLVITEVLIVDRKGNAVLNLEESDFVVTENDVPQKTEVFLLGEKATIPRSIVLIIDYSESQIPYIKDSIEAAKVLVDRLPPQDRMAIVTDDVKLLADFTNDKELLKKKLDSLYKKVVSKEFGRSEQYTAVLVALNEMFDEEDVRPILILQSDGDELYALKRTEPPAEGEYIPSSKMLGIVPKEYSYKDIYSVVSKSRATIYSIVPGPRFINYSQQERITRMQIMIERRAATFNEMWRIKLPPARIATQQLTDWSNWFLKQQLALLDIAKLSGGYLEFLEKPEDANQVYTNIFAAMNNRYLIGYYPTNLEADGKQRKVKIEVKGHPEYIVVGRKTYFAPEQ